MRDAAEMLIQEVESNPDYTSVGYGALPNPDYTSVGYGALPNPEGMMEVDAAFMDRNSMALVAVAGIQHVLHPPHTRGQTAELMPYR